MKSRRQMMIFMPLVFVWISQFCRDVIGRQNVKVAVIGRLLFGYYFRLLFVCTSVSFLRSCMTESFIRCR